MNAFERQAQLFRELTELQAATNRSLTDLFTNSVRQYVELNQDFAKRLPSGGDLNAWSELSREYGEAVWTNYGEHVKSRGEILQEAMGKTSEAFSTAYAADEEPKPAAVAAVTA